MVHAPEALRSQLRGNPGGGGGLLGVRGVPAQATCPPSTPGEETTHHRPILTTGASLHKQQLRGLLNTAWTGVFPRVFCFVASVEKDARLVSRALTCRHQRLLARSEKERTGDRQTRSGASGADALLQRRVGPIAGKRSRSRACRFGLPRAAERIDAQGVGFHRETGLPEALPILTQLL